jgi:hypothetical protein
MNWAISAIAVGSFIAAAVLCLERANRSKKGYDFRLGDTSWDFSTSWVTNLSAVGSVLGLVLTNSGDLPQSNLKGPAVAMSVFFGALVVLGPITYSAMKVEQANHSLAGTVGGFLLASGFVLWAVIGEALTAAAFFIDIAQKLPPLIPELFVPIVAFAVIMLVRYGWLNMGWVVEQAKPPSDVESYAPDVLHNWHLL